MPYIPTSIVADTAGQWSIWTPQLTASSSNPTLGSGSVQGGRYFRIGDFVYAWAMIDFGTSGTNAGSGTYRVSVPVPFSSNQTAFSFISGVWVFDSSASTGRIGLARKDGANDWVLMWLDSATSSITEASPWAWSTSDQLRLFMMYEAA